ncbi:PadR family transcriptional regulator [Halorientalis marina]|jgi:DNA-binding PadR family transcriptional regulator|uniref:PadR family transcriptional regulator n=1 Tax=Halorientalis marina TaxID=2931976 RepID=UPI001FF50AFA|nr:PadR family transcriptional regulator [Halorientalis marina]
MFDLTGFQRDIVYVIAGREDPTGVAVKEGLGRCYDVEINHGRLYPNLDTLVDADLVVKRAKNDRANIYKLSDRGITALRERRQWENKHLRKSQAVIG